MGSSDTGTSTGAVECTVGAIVWVRRRNGSWWPGKILGTEELSASHLMSPRSGTPVKLLGREDASVDWYNLEKSKRVKAFRCGEFDDCIDKAEAAQGMPPKKREKYARREDAIIHALELEKQFLEKQYGRLGSSNCKSNIKKELATSAESLRHGNGNGKVVEPKCQQPSGGPDLPPCGVISPPQKMQEVTEGRQLSWDDDNADVLPRMRGLQDIGLKNNSSNHKISPPTGPLKSPLNDSFHASLNCAVSTENTSHANDITSSEKRKRSYDGLSEDSLVKKRDRRRPLVQVLESSAKLPTPPLLKPEDDIVSLDIRGVEQTGVGNAMRTKCVYQTKSSDSTDNTETHCELMEVPASKLKDNSNPRTGLGKDDTSGSTEDTETDSSETDSLESDTDDEMDEISDESVEFRPKSMVKSEIQEEVDDSTSTEETDDPATPSDMSHPSNDDVSASAGVSKWQLKGKRNNRALTKRYVDLNVGKVFKGSNQGTKLKEKGSYDDMMDSFDKKYGTGIGRYGSRGLNGISRNTTSWEDLARNDQRVSKGYWGDPIEYTDLVYSGRRFGERRRCMLVEVDLKVQSNYQREHVPMISLMSKLNGQAIVGHPIQIETLENGSMETLLTAANELNQDNDKSLPPVWRTARRTANCRVPRPRALTVDEDEGAEHLQHVYQDRKISLNKSNGGNFSNKTSLARKSSTHGSRPTDKRSLKKPAKKTSVASNQKTRTLSSIATQPNNILKHGYNNSHVNGVTKPETVPSAVACIPVKLVFSRLHEDLGGRHR